MIVDAPLSFPAEAAYYMLGDTPTTRKLQRILSKFRPGAPFKGFAASPAAAAGGKLVVCDMSEPYARALIGRRDDDDIILFPLPVQDVWSYWDYADIALELTPPAAPFLPPAKALLEVLAEKGEIEFEVADGNPAAFNPVCHICYHSEEIEPYRDLIDKVRDGLSDAASKSLYEQMMGGHPLDQLAYYAERVFQRVQYFEFLNYGVCRTVLNGGVFEGFELPFYAVKLPQDAVVYNIDPLGHEFLSDYSRHWLEAASIDWREQRLALARQPGEIEMGALKTAQFSSNQEVINGSAVQITVPTISIDALVEAEKIAKVDLIKLDLEGDDAEALAGAVNTIVNHRPQIAASIYHQINDFWRIPELLMRLCQDYSFYLGAYSRERWETVLYAIPNEVGRGES